MARESRTEAHNLESFKKYYTLESHSRLIESESVGEDREHNFLKNPLGDIDVYFQ